MPSISVRAPGTNTTFNINSPNAGNVNGAISFSHFAILIGGSGLRLVNAADPMFTFLGEVGFAVTMFVAGTHVPVNDARLRPALLTGVLRAAGVGVVSAAAGYGVAAAFGTGHGAVYAVIMASSSAALVLPAADQLGLGGDQLLPTLAQVAEAALALRDQHAVRAAGDLATGAPANVGCGQASCHSTTLTPLPRTGPICWRLSSGT